MKKFTIISVFLLSACSLPLAHFEPMENSEGKKTFKFITNKGFIQRHGNGNVDNALKNGLPLYMGGNSYCVNGYTIDQDIATPAGDHTFYGSCN